MKYTTKINSKSNPMKKSAFLKIVVVCAIALLINETGFAQNPITVSAAAGTTLYKQGTNSGNLIGPVVTETPDLITTGTKVPYLVIPDPLLNPTWVLGADATNTTGIVSTWTWTIPGVVSSTVATTGHYLPIDVTGTAGVTGTISVAEQGAGCPGAATTINVRVVAKPTATAMAVSDGTAPLNQICQPGTNGTLNVPFPTYSITKTTDAAIPGDAKVQVKATLVFTNFVTAAVTTYFTDAILNVDATTGNISNTDLAAAATPTIAAFNSWGTYALTITAISDKISRKDLNAAKGFFAASQTATYTILKTPTTGAIYHLSNN